jgi:uncharacterized protein (DUF2267 family)
VKYEKFLDRVAERAGVSREQAEALTRATLEVLADRISGGQDDDLAARLPEELARMLRKAPQKLPEKYGFDEFVEKVRDRALDIPPDAVLPGIRAVFLTLRDAAGGKEFRDTMEQLPHQFRELLQDEGGAAQGAAQEDALVQRTADRAGVSTEDAVLLTQATLEVLGDRIGGQQAHDLSLRLPEISALWLDEPVETPAQDYGVDDFVSRVRVMVTDVEDDDITPGIQAVLISLRDAVGDAELDIALEPLSGDYDVLVRVD